MIAGSCSHTVPTNIALIPAMDSGCGSRGLVGAGRVGGSREVGRSKEFGRSGGGGGGGQRFFRSCLLQHSLPMCVIMSCMDPVLWLDLDFVALLLPVVNNWEALEDLLLLVLSEMGPCGRHTPSFNPPTQFC